MKRIIYNMWRYCVVLMFATVAWGISYGQNVVFTADASAAKIGLRDQVQVQYTIKDAQNLQTITNPSDADFAIVGGPYQSQSSSTQIIGNKMVTSQSVSLTYLLQPKHEGTFTIPGVTAKDAAGHTYQSNPITIQVVAGSLAQQQQPQRRARGYDPFSDQDDDIMAMMRQMQQMQQAQMQRIQQMQQMQQSRQQPGQQQQAAEPDAPINDEQIKNDLFIRVAADKTKVKVGEQVTISYKLYSRIPMQMSISKLPSLNGFWTQDFEIPKQAKPTEEVINGKKYQVFLLKKSALFPQQTGTLELDPAEAKGVARIVQQVRRRMADMFDPFGGGTLMMSDPVFNNTYYNTMAYRDVQVHLKSTPIKITVSSLPENGMPKDFGGAVGKFTVSSKIDKKSLTTDDVATITLNIEGSGNLKLIEAPALTLPNGLSTYDPVIIDTITGRSTTISGSKLITYVISPQTPGDYDVPGFTFTYFDVEKNKYVTTTTQPFKLNVKPGKGGSTAQQNGGVSYKDIHDIEKRPPESLVYAETPAMHRGYYWLFYVLPLALYFGAVSFRRREEELAKDVVSLKRKRANKIALQRLTTARKLLAQQEKKQFYEEVSKAIWLYLSDKLSIPLSSLSRETAADALGARKVPADLQRTLDDVILECETSLYASGGSRKMSDTYDDAVAVISKLEDVFKA